MQLTCIYGILLYTGSQICYNIKMEHVLQKNSLKTTPARVAILGLFKKINKPISAEYIVTKVSKEKIDQVTVYRTLHSFEKAKIIRRVDMRQDAVFYELADEHHHHVICTSCGEVEDFNFCIKGGLEEKIISQSKKFSHISDHSLELFSVCKPCIKNSKK